MLDTHTTSHLPDWLTAPEPSEPSEPSEPPKPPKPEDKFEAAFDDVIDRMYEGYHFMAAVEEHPLQMEPGAFLRWVRKDPERTAKYEEAKIARTEVWSGFVLKHALGTDTINDVARDSLIVSQYRWLMECENRRGYGKQTTVDVNNHTRISINAALSAADARVINGITIEHGTVDNI